MTIAGIASIDTKPIKITIAFVSSIPPRDATVFEYDASNPKNIPDKKNIISILNSNISNTQKPKMGGDIELASAAYFALLPIGLCYFDERSLRISI